MKMIRSSYNWTCCWSVRFNWFKYLYDSTNEKSYSYNCVRFLLVKYFDRFIERRRDSPICVFVEEEREEEIMTSFLLNGGYFQDLPKPISFSRIL